MRRYRRPGELLPRGYGTAWWDWARNQGVCYPVPINLLARWARAAWLRLARGPRQKAEMAAFRRGVSASEASCIGHYARGVADGRAQLHRELMERVSQKSPESREHTP